MASIRLRDAAGHFVNRQTWELAYRLAGETPPRRLGTRNARAPLTIKQVARAARKHRKVAPAKPAKPAKRTRAKPPQRVVKEKDVALPRGTEFELTARYSNRQARSLHLKIRVGLTSPMTAEQARDLLDSAMRTGHVPPGINVFALDWHHGDGGRGKEGSYMDPRNKTLRDFYGVIGGDNRTGTRFARVESEYSEDERDELEDGDDDDGEE